MKNKFGREKTIKIHISEQKDVSSLLSGISDCTIEYDSGVVITVRSSQSEQVLQDILKILASNHVTVEDLSVVPTSLEEIFLSVVKNSNA